LLLEHLEHPVRDEKPAHDVRHGGEQGDPPEEADELGVLGARDRDDPTTAIAEIALVSDMSGV